MTIPPPEYASVTQAVAQDFPPENMTYLTKRGKMYYFRARIPFPLQKYFPSVHNQGSDGMAKEVYVRSLRTDRFDLAKLRCGELLGKMSSLMDYCLNQFVQEEDKYQKVLEVCYEGRNPAVPLPPKQPRQRGELHLSDLIKLYTEEKGHKWKPTTTTKANGAYWLLLQYQGDLTLRRINRDWCRAYREWVKAVPKGAGAHRSVDFATMCANPSLPRLDPATAADKFEWLASLIKFGFQEGKLGADFSAGLAKKVKSKPRTAYTPEEVKRWSSMITFDSAAPDRFYVWLLALFQGGRINEWCQLYCEDVIEYEGQWCVNIVGNGTDKRVKNGEERIAPIHSMVIKLRFLDFVKAQKKKGHARLFPHLKYDDKKGYANATGQHFIRQNKELGFGKTFHCLRHTFATQLKYCHAQPLVVKELTGHKFTDLTFGHYGEHFPIETLSTELEKLTFDLDWEHLEREAGKVLNPR